ncbi:exodeoxyribonuclease III [Chromatiales bacterium (ex Bugula neritina AB1)]|nr:exodeoxyribonuclease III [Chromatiales bacterium (ex Bugula neritina AB1)]
MKIVSFNVNSLRLRFHQLEALIEKHEPDIIGLQETKVPDLDFPIEQVCDMGYHVEFHGQKTHYGVAMLSRLPFKSVIKGLPGDTEESQRRLITGSFETRNGNAITVINGYFPNGEKRDHPVKFPGKEKFYAELTAHLHTDYKNTDAIAVIGDFNICPVDEDIGLSADRIKAWLRSGHVSFLPEERDWFTTLQEFGLDDTYRIKYPNETGSLSWFDYRTRGFDRDPKSGLRIDHLLTTKPLTSTLIDSGMDYDIRGMEKPSDHCPVWSEFDY